MGDEAEAFGSDPLGTLGEILAYCQVMYEAIRKLDEKLEALQARVVHVQDGEPGLQTYTPYYAPYGPEEDSNAPGVPVRSRPSSPEAPPPRPDASKPPRTAKEILQRRRRKSGTPGSGRSKTPPATPGVKFVIPSGVLARASAILKPAAAARFLLQSLFSQRELLQGSAGGCAARGLKKLDPDKIHAIREWVQKAYPELDFSEDGKDWKACTAPLSDGTRRVRPRDRKRKVQEAVHHVLQGEAGQRKVQLCAVGEFSLEPAAEIDVELSDSDGADLTAQGSESKDPPGVFLGSPGREVRVPRSALLAASRRQNPPLVARHLIRFLFPEDLLVQSNVYGNGKHGIRPLDRNKISALREHLCERFPSLDLNEDGPNWRACVLAINSSIRKTRHTRKKGGVASQDPDPGP